MRTVGKIWLILIVILLSGCNASRWCAKHNPIAESKDSIHTIETTLIKHDTMFKVLPDSSSLTALIDCRGEKAKLLSIISYQSGKTTVGVPKVNIRHDTLFVECPPLDTLKLYAHWYEKIIKEDSKTTISKSLIKIEQSKWQKIVGYFGYALMGMISLVLIYIILKLATKLKLPI
jgi:hypothetical protein